MEAAAEENTTQPQILCIEDEAGMLDLLRLILESAGYAFLGAEDGLQGLDMMRKERPDLVLLDLMLPDVDGAEVLLRKKEDPAIRDIPVPGGAVRSGGGNSLSVTGPGGAKHSRPRRVTSQLAELLPVRDVEEVHAPVEVRRCEPRPIGRDGRFDAPIDG